MEVTAAETAFSCFSGRTVMALDRVNPGVHFPSDDAAGIIPALVMVYASWAAYSGT